MLVTNLTGNDYWFGPLHLAAGSGQTLTVDDTSATSLYLNDDSVADAINNLYHAGKISVSSAAQPFPRPTGVPQLLHGDGSPDGRVFAPQGSVYMRRDNPGPFSALYIKTTGITFSTGWGLPALPTGIIQPYAGSTPPSTDWLLCDGSAVSRTFYASLFAVVGTAYGGGDGSTTFNLPDLRGRVPVGFAASGGHADVSVLGNSEGTTLAGRRPKHPHANALTLPNHAHSHSLLLPDHQHPIPGVATGGTDFASSGAPWAEIATVESSGVSSLPISISGSIGNPTSNPAINGTIGAAGTANDAPAYLVVNYIIKT